MAKQNRSRMFISVILSLVLHGLVFIAVQFGVHAEPEEMEEYSGPIVVTLNLPQQTVDITPERGRGVEREMVQRSEQEQPEVVATEAVPERELPSSREPVLSETKTSVPPETGHPEIIREEEEVKVVRRDTGIERSESMMQRGGREEWVEESVFKEVGRRDDYVSTDEKITIDRDMIFQEEERKKTGPVFPSPPEQEAEKPLAFNLDVLDQAIEEGKEGAAAGGAPEGEQRGVSGDVLKKAGMNITWDDESSGRVLLASGGKPDIPEWVQREGLDLTIEIVFLVTPEGHTTALAVTRSSGYSEADAAVLDAVRQLRFNPIREEKSVRGWVSYLISTK